MKIKTVKITDIKTNPNNPRLIKDDKFNKLVKSIKEFPEMLDIRPIVVNADMIVLGGNMRLKACKDAGLKEIPIILADDLTEDQQRQFIIKDNVGFGEWDWEMIANEWDAEEISEWGLDVPFFDSYTDKNNELEMEDMESDMTINLKYNEDDFYKVKEALSKISSTPEDAVYKLLNL